jgi:glycerol-3-phosphate dehydrogenase
MFDQLCEELDVPFNRNGLITFTVKPEGMEKLRDQENNARLNGVPVEILDLPALRRIEPGMGDDVIGGLWAPSSGMVCPYTLVFALAENAAKNGVAFELNTEALDFRRIGAVWSVITNRGNFETRVILNCAGTHAGELNNKVSKERIRIIPRQGEHLILDRRYGPLVKTTLGPPSEDLPGGGHTKGMGLMPSVDGTVIIGCNALDVEDPEDLRSTAGGIAEILRFCRNYWKEMPIGRVVKEFPLEGVIGAFTGVRAHPEGDDYIIGEVRDAPNFFNAAGIESPGITAGPAIGLHLAEAVARSLGVEARRDFCPRRIAKRSFRTMTREEREAAIREDPGYARMACRCEQVTEAEIRDAIRHPLGARNLNGVKMRTRAGMGRCQGGFCGPRVVRILGEELGLDPLELNLSGEGSYILSGRACEGPVDFPGGAGKEV